MKPKQALAAILEYAKAIRDLADSPHEVTSWSRVIDAAYDALGKPNMAQLDRIRAGHSLATQPTPTP